MFGNESSAWCTLDERDNLYDIGKWEPRGSTQHALQYEEFCREWMEKEFKIMQGS